ncbi:MAG: hypothetical protein ACI91O_001782, partial [Candidatus Poriferisodalaceae bacterium]
GGRDGGRDGRDGPPPSPSGPPPSGEAGDDIDELNDAPVEVMADGGES